MLELHITVLLRVQDALGKLNVDVNVANTDEHIRFQNNKARAFHLPEDSKSYLQVLDIILLVLSVELDLKVAAVVLIRMLLIPKGYNEIINIDLFRVTVIVAILKERLTIVWPVDDVCY